MIGRIILSATHRGTIFTQGGATYALLNGQAISRSTYPSLSAVWPSGMYGGGDTTAATLNLPDTNNLYLRGSDYTRGADPNSSTRVALSGFAPSGVAIGSYQTGGTKAHVHISGTQAPDGGTLCGPGGEGGGSASLNGATSTQADVFLDSRTAGRPMQGNTANIDYDVDHTKCYFYIAVA